jgi:hypothetical protein
MECTVECFSSLDLSFGGIIMLSLLVINDLHNSNALQESCIHEKKNRYQSKIMDINNNNETKNGKREWRERDKIEKYLQKWFTKFIGGI